MLQKKIRFVLATNPFKKNPMHLEILPEKGTPKIKFTVQFKLYVANFEIKI